MTTRKNKIQKTSVCSMSRTDKENYEAYKNVSKTLKAAVARLGYKETARLYSIMVGKKTTAAELKKMLE